MSADNWARCPRCSATERARLDSEAERVQQLYGTVPVEEFDSARKAFERDRASFNDVAYTFREDYEIYGAEDGTVTVSYHGGCQKCGLSLVFREDRRIPGLDEPAPGRTGKAAS